MTPGEPLPPVPRWWSPKVTKPSATTSTACPTSRGLPTMVLLPMIVDAVGKDAIVLGAGGISDEAGYFVLSHCFLLAQINL